MAISEGPKTERPEVVYVIREEIKVYIVYDTVNHIILGCFKSFDSACEIQARDERFTIKELFLAD